MSCTRESPVKAVVERSKALDFEPGESQIEEDMELKYTLRRKELNRSRVMVRRKMEMDGSEIQPEAGTAQRELRAVNNHARRPFVNSSAENTENKINKFRYFTWRPDRLLARKTTTGCAFPFLLSTGLIYNRWTRSIIAPGGLDSRVFRVLSPTYRQRRGLHQEIERDFSRPSVTHRPHSRP
ncbi:hypothetical protein J6590_018870 [Homalodisca vitripennis]|nr:hypothetical protein J6590_018870 [Homalodisca vitripennis]